MIILNGDRMTDLESLHAHLKDRLNLPDYYGENLDALNDCLSSTTQRELIVLRRFSDFAEYQGEYGLTLLQVFSDNGWQVLLD